MDSGGNTQGWAQSPVSKLFPIPSLPDSLLAKPPRVQIGRLQALTPSLESPAPLKHLIEPGMQHRNKPVSVCGSKNEFDGDSRSQWDLPQPQMGCLSCPARTKLLLFREQAGRSSAVTSTATVPVGVLTQLLQLYSVENFPTNPVESSKSSDAPNPKRPKFSSTLLF